MLTKEEAYKAMLVGHKVRHDYYLDYEYLTIVNDVIYDENGCAMGGKGEEFWSIIQKWQDGWSVV